MIVSRPATVLAALTLACLAGQPALAIQEVQLGPRAPSFAAASSAGFAWQTLPMPSNGLSFSGAPAQRDPASWAFNGGATERLGSFLFNTSSGPSWSMAGNMGFSSGLTRFGGFGDLGFTTRTTSAVMATENLMFYTSVGRTTYAGGGVSPVPSIGLGISSTPMAQTDIRAGFKMELMPGLTFGMEAGFAPQR